MLPLWVHTLRMLSVINHGKLVCKRYSDTCRYCLPPGADACLCKNLTLVGHRPNRFMLMKVKMHEQKTNITPAVVRLVHAQGG